MSREYQVAGPRLAAMSRVANEMGVSRIREALKGNRDLKLLSQEHRVAFHDRAAAITYVENTGKPAMAILEKYKCVDIERSGGLRK